MSSVPTAPKNCFGFMRGSEGDACAPVLIKAAERSLVARLFTYDLLPFSSAKASARLTHGPSLITPIHASMRAAREVDSGKSLLHIEGRVRRDRAMEFRLWHSVSPPILPDWRRKGARVRWANRSGQLEDDTGSTSRPRDFKQRHGGRLIRDALATFVP